MTTHTGLTNTDQALTYVRQNMFATAHGGRSDAKDYLIVLTDGASANRNLTIQEAGLLKQQNVNILAIGIGASINEAELQGMASDKKHVFTVRSFDALKTVRTDIKAAACEGTYARTVFTSSAQCKRFVMANGSSMQQNNSK